jgi:cytochrome c oxidase subunit 4
MERRILYRVAAALLTLLALTVGVSFINLGPLNFAVAMTIAVAKALLVVLFFMEARTSDRLTWIMAGAGVFWLLLLLGGTLSDALTRAVSIPLLP